MQVRTGVSHCPAVFLSPCVTVRQPSLTQVLSIFFGLCVCAVPNCTTKIVHIFWLTYFLFYSLSFPSSFYSFLYSFLLALSPIITITLTWQSTWVYWMQFFFFWTAFYLLFSNFILSPKIMIYIYFIIPAKMFLDVCHYFTWFLSNSHFFSLLNLYITFLKGLLFSHLLWKLYILFLFATTYFLILLLFLTFIMNMRLDLMLLSFTSTSSVC